MPHLPPRHNPHPWRIPISTGVKGFFPSFGITSHSPLRTIACPHRRPRPRPRRPHPWRQRPAPGAEAGGRAGARTSPTPHYRLPASPSTCKSSHLTRDGHDLDSLLPSLFIRSLVIMKRKLPLIGVRRWSDIHPTVHRLIVADMIDRWNLENTPETEEKILKIAMERYRGWRSTLSSTYKAYKTDDARLANVPEDLQPEEWEWMIDYFGKDEKFQERSQKNSDNRKKQKTKHRAGSKSYSQLSFEKRNVETGEEPDCIALWELTHTKNGTWSNAESQDVYDKARQAAETKETETNGPLSSEQRNNVFQTAYKDTLKCKSSQPRGYGYMAKPKTGSERFRMQIEEQARATAEYQQQNSELSQQVNGLQDQLEAERADMQDRLNLERAEREQLEERLQQERAERERLLEEERRSRLEFEKNMMAKFNQQMAKLSQQMGNQQQVLKKRTDKENSNPNLQTTPLQSSSPSRNPGARTNMISSNQLLLNSRMYRAVDQKK